MDCSAKAYSGTEPFIFISYAHDDAHLVYPIVERLVMDGFRVWYDDGIHAGEDWTETVAARLGESAICIPMLTENYVRSVNCRNELAYSLNKGKSVISIKLTDFELPGSIELQLGSAMYVEKYRYGETEFYERLQVSHGILGCRDEAPRITDGELMAWRNKWANATPIRKAKGEPDRVKLQAPDVSKATRGGSKKGLLIGIAGLVVLAVLAVVFLPRLMKKESPAELTPLVSGTETAASGSSAPAEAVTETPVSAETPASEEVPAATEETPAATEETTAEELPVQGSPEPDSSGWRELKITPEGDGMQILSCRYRGDVKLLRLEYFDTNVGDAEGYFHAYFEKNDVLATEIGGAWYYEPVDDVEVEFMFQSAQMDAAEVYVADSAQNPILVKPTYGRLSRLEKGQSMYFLWFVASPEREIVMTAVTEIGYPSDDAGKTEPAQQEKYTVTFVANGGFFETNTAVPQIEYDFTIPAGYTLSRGMFPSAISADGTKRSYNWYYDRACTKAVGPDGILPTGNVRVYAEYRIFYEITIDLNGGRYIESKKPMKFMVWDGLHCDDVKGYLAHDPPDSFFTGFYLDKDCTEESRITEELFVPDTTSVTIYAGWSSDPG